MKTVFQSLESEKEEVKWQETGDGILEFIKI